MTKEEAIKLLGLATKPRVTKEIELSVAPDVTDKFLEAIDMAIKALEQPEIVYCRYCEHANFVKLGVWCCKGGGGLVSPDFFCRHGKRGER